MRFTLTNLVDSGRDFQFWYSEAHEQIKTVCEAENWDVTRFCDVLALTSPKTAVIRNIRHAFTYMQHGHPLGDCMKSVRASLRNYENGLGFSKVAFKTKPFAAALNGDLDAIVLDSWMAKVYRIEQKLFARKAERERCQNSIKRLARKFSMRYAELQACLWAGIQRLIDWNPAKFSIVDEYNNWLTYERNYPLYGTIETIPF